MLFKRLEELKDEDLQSLFFRETGIQDVLPVVNEILMEVASKVMRLSSGTLRSLRGPNWMTFG